MVGHKRVGADFLSSTCVRFAVVTTGRPNWIELYCGRKWLSHKACEMCIEVQWKYENYRFCVMRRLEQMIWTKQWTICSIKQCRKTQICSIQRNKVAHKCNQRLLSLNWNSIWKRVLHVLCLVACNRRQDNDANCTKGDHRVGINDHTKLSFQQSLHGFKATKTVVHFSSSSNSDSYGIRADTQRRMKDKKRHSGFLIGKWQSEKNRYYFSIRSKWCL